jgi:RNA polymerase sigma factor for flagellar operon FliA
VEREEMIVQNLPLVTFVVGKMTTESGASPLEREEAVAYGVEGLIQAVDNYDPTRGTTFASFAIRRIRGSILDAIRRMDVLPRSLRRSAREIERATLDLAAMLGRWPSVRELAIRLNLSVDDVREIAGHSGSRVVSLDRLMTERLSEGPAARWEVTDRDEFSDPAVATDHRAILQVLDTAIGALPERDKQIIQLRYARSMSFHEIGRLMSLSESRVCQLHKRILAGLRRFINQATEAAA